MLSSQEEQADRLATLENDRRMLEQQRGSTFHQHAQAQANDTAGGRFAAVGVPRVVGSVPNPSSQYPAAAAHQADPVGVEPPLGIDINAMPGLENPADVSVSPSADPGGAAAPSCPSDVEHAPPSSSPNGDPAGVPFPSPPDTSCDVDAGPSSNKRSE
jgi:hypothetical protein